MVPKMCRWIRWLPEMGQASAKELRKEKEAPWGQKRATISERGENETASSEEGKRTRASCELPRQKALNLWPNGF